jgi:hypothetical protein
VFAFRWPRATQVRATPASSSDESSIDTHQQSTEYLRLLIN